MEDMPQRGRRAACAAGGHKVGREILAEGGWVKMWEEHAII